MRADQSGEFASPARALQRAGKDVRINPPTEMFTQPPGLMLALFSQWNITQASVPA
jgi:hypothetical protein